MSWLRKLLGRASPGPDRNHLINLRTTRFRQLIRSYGRVQELAADAAEKQSGDFVLDRQYMLALAQNLLDLAESTAFDLNVMTDNGHLAYFDDLQRIRLEIEQLLNRAHATPATDRSPGDPAPVGAVLARVLAHAPVLTRGKGRVACRGLGAGPVFRLDRPDDLARLPAGAVLVAHAIAVDGQTEPLLGRAAAILVGEERAFGQLADPARAVRVPAIVGLGSALQQLATGTEVTVDADENTVYAGTLRELVEYYERAHLDTAEEPEYRLLRDLRRAAFELSPTAGDPATGAPACRSLLDLVHSGQLLAGDVVAGILFDAAPTAEDEIDPALPETLTGRVIILGDDLADCTAETGVGRQLAARSDPLQFFLAGVRTGSTGDGPLSGAAPASESLVALAKDQHAIIARRHADGLDLVDAMISESPDYNHVYCRFAAGAGEQRGAVAEAVLARHKFATTRSAGATTGWIAGLPHAGAAAQLELVGRLHAQLLAIGTRGGARRDDA